MRVGELSRTPGVARSLRVHHKTLNWLVDEFAESPPYSLPRPDATAIIFLRKVADVPSPPGSPNPLYHHPTYLALLLPRPSLSLPWSLLPSLLPNLSTAGAHWLCAGRRRVPCRAGFIERN